MSWKLAEMDHSNHRNQFFPVDCPICEEAAKDPRILPCGHSYCGPSNSCLSALKKIHGLECFVCKEPFNLHISQLRPLFEIDLQFLDNPDSSNFKHDTTDIMCVKHYGSSVKFWCLSCKKSACLQCFELEHESHSLISFRSYLKQEVVSTHDKIVNEFGNYSQENAMNGHGKENDCKSGSSRNDPRNSAKNCDTNGNNNDQENGVNIINSFLSTSFECFALFEKELKTITSSNPPNLTCRSESSFVIDKQRNNETSSSFEEQKTEIGRLQIPYKNVMVQFTFFIKTFEEPTFEIETKITNRFNEGAEKRGTLTYLGKIYIRFPALIFQENTTVKGKLAKDDEKIHNLNITLPNVRKNKSVQYDFRSEFSFS